MILTYLIKSTLCLAVLYGFYKIALETKAMHQFKRFYLLASLAFAFTIPLVTFTYETEVFSKDPISITPTEYLAPLVETQEVIATPLVDYTSGIVWGIYGLGVVIFGLRFGMNLFRLKRKIDTAHLIPEKDFTLALLGKHIVPHSFFKWIFLNASEYRAQKIAPEVLAHEATHVRQRHSWDILFIEFLQVVFWFNPLVWLAKSSIKLNHEFLADQGAIDNKSNIAIYQNILLSYASSTHHTALESPFNYSLTKRRIVMLSQSFSRKKVVLRALLLVPIVGVCVLLFNQAIVAQAKIVPVTIPQSPPSQELVQLWQDADNYQLYLDEKPIANASILKYDRENLPFYETKFEKGKTVVSIWTTSYWKKMNEQKFSTFSNTDFSRVPKIIVKGSEVTINGKASSGETYKDDLNTLTAGWTEEEMRQAFPSIFVTINADPVLLKKLDEQLRLTDYWKATVSYTETSLEKVAQKTKTPLIIEIRNNQVTVIGKKSSIATFQKDVDAATEDWEETDYTDPPVTYYFKGNSKNFLDKLEIEYAKTHISKANGGIGLVPPPPPAPDFPDAPPPPQSPVKHLEKMNKLGGKFYHEGEEVSFTKAVQLVRTNTSLNIQTPVPYDKPPQTYLSMEPIHFDQLDTQRIGVKKMDQKKIQKGDTHTITEDATGKAHSILIGDPIKASSKEVQQYNRLAKKYNAQPRATRKITAGNLKTLETIYRKMTDAQKEVNQPFPECEQED